MFVYSLGEISNNQRTEIFFMQLCRSIMKCNGFEASMLKIYIDPWHFLTFDKQVRRVTNNAYVSLSGGREVVDYGGLDNARLWTLDVSR